MQITPVTLRRIAAMPEQAMRETLFFLADMLEAHEAVEAPRRAKAIEKALRCKARLGLSAAAWQELRTAVLKRDDHTCQYCGNHAETVDHIVPLAAGGSSEPDNLCAACGSCNSSKRDRPVHEWERPSWD